MKIKGVIYAEHLTNESLSREILENLANSYYDALIEKLEENYPQAEIKIETMYNIVGMFSGYWVYNDDETYNVNESENVKIIAEEVFKNSENWWPETC